MEYKIKTNKSQEFIDITDIVDKEIKRENVQDGIAVIFVPHTTAGVTINENADPDVVDDLIMSLKKHFL